MKVMCFFVGYCVSKIIYMQNLQALAKPTGKRKCNRGIKEKAKEKGLKAP
ncbi:hypothetical protein KUC3_37170 [Alteromonas sp. KC3]|nr:hypothetical protein KUC3_37170 [Alteromonas sp. KC3]BCO24830.1 hypothetical protein KUC14_36990 [Alteromonas sp. KC14]